MGEERFAEGKQNGPGDHFERRTPRAWASGRTAARNARLALDQISHPLPGKKFHPWQIMPNG